MRVISLSELNPKTYVLTEVIESAKKAQIHDYILSLDKGYSTIIGERGVKLSGGQKQRLGIARAFYKKSLIMVLDEATSALDNETEKFVIDSISSVSKDLTVIFIAHRYASLKTCDRIIRIEDGRVTEDGRPPTIIGNQS